MPGAGSTRGRRAARPRGTYGRAGRDRLIRSAGGGKPVKVLGSKNLGRREDGQHKYREVRPYPRHPSLRCGMSFEGLEPAPKQGGVGSEVFLDFRADLAAIHVNRKIAVAPE